ncbi:PrsW family intramembrane metalloprotease [Phormidium tenue FACHB-886]|nr:PrsW family intramembrane metalloprotease [Phormidium tenue FACHB-886]
MTGSPPQAAFLRQVSAQGSPVSSPPYPLPANTIIVIGRDPRCQIILDSQAYGGVSRQHAELSVASHSPSGWQICDLKSANGTFVNGQRLQGCHHLQAGDRIRLAQDGPQFIFEILVLPQPVPPPVNSPNPPLAGSVSTTQPKPQSYTAPDSVTFSQLFPIVSTGRDLTRKAYLIPGILTVTFVVLMFISVGSDPLYFNLLLATYIAGAAYYFVYQLCGKLKPWWLLVGTAIMTVLLLVSPVLDLFILVFRVILPGGIPDNTSEVNFFVLLVRMFFGAGLMEELLKAIPIFIVYFLGSKLRSPKRELIGVWEPLDGILLGTASAVGFTLLETLVQYVPEIINSVSLQAGEGIAQVVGIQLLVPRILGSISGHMAYSGYFGYFIGLSILKPSKRWKILLIGYLTSASLHALWNATGSINFLILAVIGIVSYAFLAAAILKARALSPNRDQNFATRFSGFK